MSKRQEVARIQEAEKQDARRWAFATMVCWIPAFFVFASILAWMIWDDARQIEMILITMFFFPLPLEMVVIWFFYSKEKYYEVKKMCRTCFWVNVGYLALCAINYFYSRRVY